MIRTYEDIYNFLKEDTGDRFTLYQVLDIFRTETDWVGTPYQLLKLKEVQTEITGIRPGNCSGCNLETMKNLSQWLTRYENERTQIVKPKIGRPRK